MDSNVIYLYLKTHNKTGLKYLGKTVSDPFKYHGSGKYWKLHLAKHGYNVTTEILFQSTCKNKIKEKGLYYSNLWSIVESNNFANLKEESGDGGVQPWPKESRKRVSKSLKLYHEKNPDAFKNRSITESQKKKMSASHKKRIKENKEKHVNTMKKHLYTEDTNIKRRKKMSKYKWWNNGNVNTRSETSPGEDFVLGRLRK